MKEWFYQIKARKQDGEYDPDDFMPSVWQWPPVFSGKVTANDRKEAREAVEEEYGRKFPMRVLEKDRSDHPYLLNIREIKERDTRTIGLFLFRECKECGAGFRVIDHYNNDHQFYKGQDFCGDECKDQWVIKDRNNRMFSENENCDGQRPPVIYKIQNIQTGMVYIGQTTQAFTLRWWQHFFLGKDTKFHKAIKSSSLEDWRFSVVEVIDMGEKPDDQSPTAYIFSREQFWINECDSINNGYNTATAKSETVDANLPLFEEAM